MILEYFGELENIKFKPYSLLTTFDVKSYLT